MSARKQALLLLLCALVELGPASAQSGPSRPAITGISHVTFYADDLQKSEAFYTNVLGWEQQPAADRSTGVRFFANHQQFIELVPAPRPAMLNRLQSFGLNTSDAERLRRYLGAHGVAVPAAVTVAPDGSRYFVTHDPEGNEVEFVQLSKHAVPAPANLSKRLSTHIIHAGFVAHNRAGLDHFYKDLLGCHLYWEGAAQAGHTDWVMMQVPDGTDWIEYMLYLPTTPSRGQLASANHFSPGVVSIAELNKRLLSQGWKPSAQERPPLLGLDGKWQLDLFDPDGTRVEFMEFEPVKTPCCSSFTGPLPGPYPGW
ncbi:catechol 2,3-dioxygenase-like lactoylglutathione lyase family enzyme [Silvibacterium bohemicum]|uniref:Catechol 2,3-dioxygenase-like lactoylglutathione lyase family enzyme n=1 Tax=Silvibacterium bohemicum TaxID=1577686 RepID=A0A841JTW8_9BACT|nr:VOC family protein [Silvibacterium bohemicum]MBB6143179.1 catechol 2,3-dioxygenase-like lactoylglutathione lyase family enzyme [Silvibacterium bohemicum]